jgi:ribosomal protein L11
MVANSPYLLAALQFIELSGQQERRDHGSIGREECEEIAQMKRNNDEATNR